MSELKESLLEQGEKENPYPSFSEQIRQTGDAFGTGVPRALRIAGLTIFAGWAVVELAADRRRFRNRGSPCSSYRRPHHICRLGCCRARRRKCRPYAWRLLARDRLNWLSPLNRRHLIFSYIFIPVGTAGSPSRGPTLA